MNFAHPRPGAVTLKLSSRNFRFKANRVSPGEISGALLRLVLIRDSFHARLANAVEIQKALRPVPTRDWPRRRTYQ